PLQPLALNPTHSGWAACRRLSFRVSTSAWSRLTLNPVNLGSHLHQTRKSDAETVQISDSEITQTVIAISNGNDDARANFVNEFPVCVNVRHHHSDVRERKRWICRQRCAMSIAECRELGQKEAMIFPGQFHEIATVSKEVES